MIKVSVMETFWYDIPMHKSRHSYYKLNIGLLLTATFMIPIWLTFGRYLLGSTGWRTFFGAIGIVAIGSFIIGLIAATILWQRKENLSLQKQKLLTVFLSLIVISMVAYGLCAVDYGDGSYTYSSVVVRPTQASSTAIVTSDLMSKIFLGLGGIFISASAAVMLSKTKRVN